ncbi:hypothetical protein ACHQM5_014508 [Ranunculus cassubicifolius]
MIPCMEDISDDRTVSSKLATESVAIHTESFPIRPTCFAWLNTWMESSKEV